MIFYSSYVFLASIYLIILTVQDCRTMYVDSKYNYIMVGIAISMVSYAGRGILYLLLIVASVMFFNYFGKKAGAFGKGDFSAFNWLFMGLALINPVALAWYVSALVVLGLVYNLTKRILAKRNDVIANKYPIPFYPVILGAWILTMPLLWFAFS